MTRKFLRKWFSSQLFSASFVRNSEAVTRGVLKKALLKNFAIFTGKQQRRGLYLIKLKKSDYKKIFLKKRHEHRCFPVNIEKFLRTYFEKHLQTTTSVKFQSSCIPKSLLALPFKWNAVWNFSAIYALALPFKWNALTFGISWQHTHSNPVGIFSHSSTILENSIYYDEFLVHLGRFIVVTWPSSFSGHRFKLESEDFIFHILQRNFSNFVIKIPVRCSVRSLQNFYFSLFCSQLVYTCSKFG